MADTALLAAPESIVQSVWGGSLRIDVQSIGPESVLAGGLGTKHRILQGSQGMAPILSFVFPISGR